MITMREVVEAVDSDPPGLRLWLIDNGDKPGLRLTKALGRWFLDTHDPLDRLGLKPGVPEEDLIQFALCHQIEVTFLAE